MDALITYSQTHQQLMNTLQGGQATTDIPGTSTANPLMLSNPIYNHYQSAGSYVHQSNQQFMSVMDQYNFQQQQNQHAKVNDFFKLFSSSPGLQSTSSSSTSSASSSSSTSSPAVFANMLPQAPFVTTPFNPLVPPPTTSHTSFLPTDDPNFYNPSFNASFVGRLASMKHLTLNNI